MSGISKAPARRVRAAASHRCEYCRLPADADIIPFHVDHIIAKKHGGKAVFGNLALCCSFCNSHKGSNIAGIDPVPKQIVPLVHPRRPKWQAHFRWSGPRLMGATPQGRATITVLLINDAINLAVRESLMAEGRLP